MRQLEIRTRRLVNDSLAGEYHSVFKGRGMDFDEVREYVPGDEVRTIDWNVTARAGRPFVKKFTEERELTHAAAGGRQRFRAISVPRAQSKRELAAELASVLALSAIRNSDKVGLLLYTDRIEQYMPPKKGRRHVLRVVREILYHDPQARGTDTVKALEFASQLLHRRAVVFLISDFQSPGDPSRGTARTLRARHAADQSPPRPGRRAHRGSAREVAAGCGRARARRCGNRRGRRARHREPAVRSRFAEEASERSRRLVTTCGPKASTPWS